jgi:putative heme iron utilization protein
MRHQRHADPIQHMNHDHAAELLTIARALGGHPDATSARVDAVDRHGIDLRIEAPSGPAAARVNFTEPIPEDGYPDGVRVAFVRLARRARTGDS